MLKSSAEKAVFKACFWRSDVEHGLQSVEWMLWLLFFCVLQHYAVLCPLTQWILRKGSVLHAGQKQSDFSSWYYYWVFTISSLLFSILRSPEIGAGGKDLSPAETSKHRWVTFGSQEIKWLVTQLWWCRCFMKTSVEIWTKQKLQLFFFFFVSVLFRPEIRVDQHLMLLYLIQCVT